MNHLYERELKVWAEANRNETFETPPPLLPIKINVDGQWMKGKLRIRGDLARHWQNEEKSLRIFLPLDAVWGMNEFDLIIPQDKGYELEATVYEMASSLGLVTPQYQFIDFQINHKKFSRFFMMERWTKASFERRNIQGGAIIGENNAWLDSVKMKTQSLYQNIFLTKTGINPLSLHPHIYRSSNSGTDSQLAMSRFALMLESPSKWKEFINTEAAAKWLALISYLGGEHAALGDNVRWLYHGPDSTFSPIIYDVLAVRVTLERRECLLDHYGKMNAFIQEWIKDPAFVQRTKFWLRLLIEKNEFSGQWKTIEKKYSLNDWPGKDQAERTKIKTIMMDNMSNVKGIEKDDFCYL